jgi:hypothetical protein
MEAPAAGLLSCIALALLRAGPHHLRTCQEEVEGQQDLQQAVPGWHGCRRGWQRCPTPLAPLHCSKASPQGGLELCDWKAGQVQQGPVCVHMLSQPRVADQTRQAVAAALLHKVGNGGPQLPDPKS